MKCVRVVRTSKTWTGEGDYSNIVEFSGFCLSVWTSQDIRLAGTIWSLYPGSQRSPEEFIFSKNSKTVILENIKINTHVLPWSSLRAQCSKALVSNFLFLLVSPTNNHLHWPAVEKHRRALLTSTNYTSLPPFTEYARFWVETKIDK